tara:strand:+ start:458 stop:613 length:156 start_codon:yes stop_codon:yes gene_type:complete
MMPFLFIYAQSQLITDIITPVALDGVYEGYELEQISTEFPPSKTAELAPEL